MISEAARHAKRLHEELHPEDGRILDPDQMPLALELERDEEEQTR